jgi:hypothetical protein
VDVASKFPGKEMLINVFAEDARKASKIYGGKRLLYQSVIGGIFVIWGI